MTDLNVTILGSGTCVPSLERSSCAVLVEAGDQCVLFDTGPGTMRRLLEAKRTIFDIGILGLSHFHPDHSGELVSFLFATRYAPDRRRDTPLKLLGGTGLKAFYEKLKGVFGRWIELDAGMLLLTEMSTHAPESRVVNGVRIRSAPVNHNPESIAYRITSPGGRSVVYSGDTDESPELIRLATGADLLICESSFPEERKAPGHLTPGMAGRIAAEAGVGRLVLTHFYPACQTADIKAQCRSTWNGPLTLAEDLLSFKFD